MIETTKTQRASTRKTRTPRRATPKTGAAACSDLLPADALEQAAECLKVMAHPVRLGIVDILMQGQFTVAQVAAICKVRPHQMCEHLRLLKGHGLLDSHRRGRQVFYRIANPRLPGLIKCIRSTCPNGQQTP